MPTSSNPASSRLRIHVADDHPAITVLLGEFIGNLGLYEEVTTTSNGLDTMAKLRSEPPDLLLLDLGLPGMSGLEVLQAIKAEKLPTKVLVYSGICEPNTLRACLDLGAGGYLEKTAPFDLIGDAIARVLAGQTVFGPLAQEAMRLLIKRRAVERDLTGRQLVALRLLREGFNAKEIAGKLGFSLSGGYKIIDRLKVRFEVETNAQLAEVAVRYGLGAGPNAEETRH
jgi:DNA-binding NarL/FixJ family response regulator